MRGGDDRGDWVSRLLDFWFAPVSPARLDLFTRALSISFLLFAGTWFLDGAREWLTPHGFHYTAANAPSDQPAPWPLMPVGLLPVFAVVFFGSLVALVVGFRPRLFVWIVLACAVYVDRVDMLAAYTMNKVYVVAYLVLALAPTARELPSGRFQSAWALRVLQITLVVHYFGSGLCKVLHGDWMGNTDIVWTQVQGVYRTDAAAWMLRTMPEGTWTFMYVGGLVFELVGPFLFLFRRTRPLIFLYGFLFHLGIAILMHRLIFFGLQMWAFYVLFFDDRSKKTGVKSLLDP